MPIVITKKEFPETKEINFSRKRDNFIEKAPQYIEAGILPREETEAVIQALKEEKLLVDKKTKTKRSLMIQTWSVAKIILLSLRYCALTSTCRTITR